MNTVSELYHRLSQSGIRPLDWEVGISWTKRRNANTSWFTLDSSTLDGPDLLADNDNNAIQLWDAYDYQLQRDRVIDMSVSRSVEFPYNIQSAVCDLTLNNYDGLFSFKNPTSPISENILPARPLRAYLGFKGAGVTPVFVGLTQSVPDYSGTNNTIASLTAMDFLSTIGEMSLRNMVMMKNARTNEVIAVILQQFGLEPHMYSLDQGLNIIPFVYFESGKNAGNALKELIQAENGAMWIDEQGIIRFTPRTSGLGSTSVMRFDKNNIISIKPSQTAGIVNRVHVEADVRGVKEYQQIFVANNDMGYQSDAEDDQYRLSANGGTTIWLSFDDPIWSAKTNLELGESEDSSSFTVLNLSGESITSGITATGTLFADAMKLEFTNENNFPVSVNYLQIWGEPAKVAGTSPTIKYTAEDEESIEHFGVQELSITDNTCFGNQQNIDAFATDILKRYAEYSPTLELSVKGDPSLQIRDIVTLDGTKYDGTWLVNAISHQLSSSGLATTITVVRAEIQTAFILNQSVLDGKDVLG